MIKVEFNKKEAIFLWNLLKDVLAQDSEGRNMGTGGVLFNEDVGCAMRSMTEFAEAIDKYIKANPEKPNKKQLMLV